MSEVRPSDRHVTCRCVELDRFGGEWGSPAVLDLFQKLGELQLRSGVHDAWVKGTREVMDTNGYPHEERQEAERAFVAELPLGAQTYMPLVTDPFSPEGSHCGYGYGLIKVNPRTGKTYGEWHWAIDLEDDGTVVDTNSGSYTSPQLTIIQNQIEAQAELGVVLSDIIFR